MPPENDVAQRDNPLKIKRLNSGSRSRLALRIEPGGNRVLFVYRSGGQLLHTSHVEEGSRGFENLQDGLVPSGRAGCLPASLWGTCATSAGSNSSPRRGSMMEWSAAESREESSAVLPIAIDPRRARLDDVRYRFIRYRSARASLLPE